MNRRAGTCVAAIGLVVTCLVSAVPAGGEPARPERPDFLFLFADDMTYEALGAAGILDVETPNLDRLAARGVTFRRAYNMGSWSGAVCVASRTMLITGRSLWDAHRVYDDTDAERRAGLLWPQLLAGAGYKTCFTGKWHIRTDPAAVFGVLRHVRPGGMPKTVPEAYNRPLPGLPDPWSPYDETLGGFWEGGTHWSEVVADDAIDFLDMANESEEPFFLYVAFNAPHDPRQAPKEYVDLYPPDRVAVPPDFLPEYPEKEAIGAGPDLRDEALAPFPRTEEAVKVHRGEYYASITHLDAQIGRILDALDRSGRADRTWVVFTADHGLAVGHHGLFGKQNQYDHSVRVPFLVAGPGVPEGRVVDAPIYLQDVMPTTLELAGVEPPDHVWFRSLLPMIRGESDGPARGAVYGAYLMLQRAVTDEGYKLILYPEAHGIRLYHVADDPFELHDLSTDPAQRLRMQRLFAQLRRLQSELGDPLDLEAVYPELN